MVSLIWGGERINATVQGVAFWPDLGPKYMLEKFDGKKWTEDYFDVFEKDILHASTKGSGNE